MKDEMSLPLVRCPICEEVFELLRYDPSGKGVAETLKIWWDFSWCVSGVRRIEVVCPKCGHGKGIY